jgi:hypothetical protein
MILGLGEISGSSAGQQDENQAANKLQFQTFRRLHQGSLPTGASL